MNKSNRPRRLQFRPELANENVYNANWRNVDAPVPPALYNLANDPGEQKTVMAHHPQITKRLEGYLEKARADIGDSLTGREPTNARPVGAVDPER